MGMTVSNLCSHGLRSTIMAEPKPVSLSASCGIGNTGRSHESRDRRPAAKRWKATIGMDPKISRRAKPRNVYRAAAAYGAMSWLLIQIATQVFPFFEIPNSSVRFVVVALVVGFPIAMLVAWLYQLTPEGFVREEEVDPVTRKGLGRKMDFVIIGVLLLVIAMLVYQRLPFRSLAGETIPQKSIAVLPFENLSADKANAFFADGIQDDILTNLTKIGDLRVISALGERYRERKGRHVLRELPALGAANVWKVLSAVRAIEWSMCI